VGRLAAMLAEAHEFAAEWAELRSLFRSRLYNTVLRLPLQEAVEEVERAAAAAGRLGTSHARFVGGQGGRADLALPPGAAWHAVKVVFPRCACWPGGGGAGCLARCVAVAALPGQ
jgi:hypothetical protein